MKEVTLAVKARDIKETRYSDSKDCAITRALARAGYPELEDVGVNIEGGDYNSVIDESDKQYRKLVKRVLGMYSHSDGVEYTGRDGVVKPIQPRNFTITLELDI